MVNPQMVLKEVQNTQFSMLSIEGSSMEVCTLYNSNVMVLKGVNVMLFSTVYLSDGLEEANSVCIHNGLERSQFLMICCIGHYDDLERSHFLVLIFSWALTLACHCIL